MSKEKEKSKKKHGFGKFLAGAAIGASLGVLFAPKAGSETRKELKEKFNELVSKVKETDFDDVREEIELKIAEIKDEIKELDKEKVLKIAKSKAKDIQKKASELVDLAKEKGTPILEDLANDAKEKTVTLLKEIIDKLEKNEK